MKHYYSVVFMALVLVLGFGTGMVSGEEKANPAECVKMCNQASEYLQNAYTVSKAQGDAALEKMRKKEGNRFVWKNSYVFVICCECNPKTAVAHPIKPNLVGVDQTETKDKKGKLFFIQDMGIAKKETDFTQLIQNHDPDEVLSFKLEENIIKLIVGADVADIDGKGLYEVQEEEIEPGVYELHVHHLPFAIIVEFVSA